MVSLQTIADKTGYSRAVVSRALNPNPDQRVAERTRRLIAAAAAELDYRPNQAARLLARGAGTAIGCFLPCSASGLVEQLIAGLAKVANRYGFSYNLFFDSPDSDYLGFLKQSCRSRNAGVLTYLPYNYHKTEAPAVLRELAAQGCRIVAINGPGFAAPDIRTVSVDNCRGGSLAAERLLAVGCRSFAAVDAGAPGSRQRGERLRGFRDRLAESGREVEILRCSMSEYHFVSDAAEREFLDSAAALPAPVGIFAADDYTALTVVRTLGSHGLRPGAGERFRLIGFDDIFSARLVTPALTTLRQPFEALGEIAMSVLLNDMVDAKIAVDLSRLEPELIVRESA